jgi:UDP-N-acetylmuramoyl-L-alanyl-D-glutamate--2,6-diaminopimelate ligase
MTEPLRPSQVRPRSIAGLLERLPTARLHGDPDALVTGITHDSREVRPGDVYLARPGERTHGIDHLDQALAAGAVAVLTDPSSVDVAVRARATAVVEVDDPRAATGPAAAWIYDDPSRDLLVIGITGTNGKTTTAYLLEAGLRSAGHRTGLVGTIVTRIDGETVPSLRTTPEATDLQALFAVMRERAVDAVAMEVSSHALALDRVSGTSFAVAGFTNLSQDHLDFHSDMEDYLAAKARLFEPSLSRQGVVDVDDVWGRRLAAGAGVPVTTIGRSTEAAGAQNTDWVRTDESVSADGGAVTMVGPDGARHRLTVGLPGRFNLSNASLAFVVLLAAGVPADAAAAGIAGLHAVPGRMERVDAGQPFTALVDYAHTPEAIGVLLAEARGLTADGGRVIAVLGCGGDRDQAKRPLMGATLAAGADTGVLTNDNPRSEDPTAIIDAMLEGARRTGHAARLVVEPDRRRAVEWAVGQAQPGDVVVVAGKGHEQGQEYADRTVPFDDRTVLRETLAAAGYSSGAA